MNPNIMVLIPVMIYFTLCAFTFYACVRTGLNKGHPYIGFICGGCAIFLFFTLFVPLVAIIVVNVIPVNPKILCPHCKDRKSVV